MTGKVDQKKPTEQSVQTLVIQGSDTKFMDPSVDKALGLGGEVYAVSPRDLSDSVSHYASNTQRALKILMKGMESKSNSHYNLLTFAHGATNLSIALNNKTFLDFSKLAKGFLGGSLFLASASCYAGGNYKLLLDPKFIQTNAMFRAQEGQVSYGQDLFYSFLTYFSLADQSYDFNQDQVRQINEAYAYAIDQEKQGDLLATMPMLIYQQAMAMDGTQDDQGRNYLGPFQRRDESGKVQSLPVLHAYNLEDLEKIIETLKPGQSLAIWLRTKGSPKDAFLENYFKEALHQPGMFRAVELELSFLEMQKFDPQSNGGQWAAPFYLVNEYGLATRHEDLSPQGLRKTYLESVTLDPQERIKVAIQYLHQEGTNYWQGLRWILEEAGEGTWGYLNQEGKNRVFGFSKDQLEILIEDIGDHRERLNNVLDYIHNVSPQMLLPCLIALGQESLVLETWPKLFDAEEKASFHLKALLDLEKKPQDEKIYQALLNPLVELSQRSGLKTKLLVQELFFQLALHYPSIKKEIEKGSENSVSDLGKSLLKTSTSQNDRDKASAWRLLKDI
ncbi:MAG: hypothetical protein KDK66_02515, partial [Deltaproteobacteria bacterium]|nr:hypothetical protein [Deltaproteobacteria bacterium]